MIYISQAGFERLVNAGVSDYLTNQVGIAPRSHYMVRHEVLKQAEHEVITELLGRYQIADDDLFEDAPPRPGRNEYVGDYLGSKYDSRDFG
jgi:hypothetical protein